MRIFWIGWRSIWRCFRLGSCSQRWRWPDSWRQCWKRTSFYSGIIDWWRRSWRGRSRHSTSCWQACSEFSTACRCFRCCTQCNRGYRCSTCPRKGGNGPGIKRRKSYQNSFGRIPRCQGNTLVSWSLGLNRAICCLSCFVSNSKNNYAKNLKIALKSNPHQNFWWLKTKPVKNDVLTLWTISNYFLKIFLFDLSFFDFWEFFDILDIILDNSKIKWKKWHEDYKYT